MRTLLSVEYLLTFKENIFYSAELELLLSSKPKQLTL